MLGKFVENIYARFKDSLWKRSWIVQVGWLDKYLDPVAKPWTEVRVPMEDFSSGVQIFGRRTLGEKWRWLVERFWVWMIVTAVFDCNLCSSQNYPVSRGNRTCLRFPVMKKKRSTVEQQKISGVDAISLQFLQIMLQRWDTLGEGVSRRRPLKERDYRLRWPFSEHREWHKRLSGILMLFLSQSHFRLHSISYHMLWDFEMCASNKKMRWKRIPPPKQRGIDFFVLSEIFPNWSNSCRPDVNRWMEKISQKTFSSCPGFVFFFPWRLSRTITALASRDLGRSWSHWVGLGESRNVSASSVRFR